MNVEYDEKTGLIIAILAEIPSNRFNTFYEQLKGTAASLYPSPEITDKGQEPVVIRVELIYPELIHKGILSITPIKPH